jgi:Mg2+-importing ATPase
MKPAAPAPLQGTNLQPPADGLSSAEARSRLRHHPSLGRGRRAWLEQAKLAWQQVKSPLIWLLIGAALLSAGLGDLEDTAIILAIVLLSGLVGFGQERTAWKAVRSLQNLVAAQCSCWRDGHLQTVPISEVVPGDLLLLQSGDFVPVDGRLLETHHLLVDQASLTGESLPVEKSSEASTSEKSEGGFADPSEVYAGSNILNGSGWMRVERCGTDTAYGKLVERADASAAPTAFEIGVQTFSAFLLEVTLVMALGIFAINAWMGKPVVDALLFSLALAVGMSPQLLPAIVMINLASGARRMAAHQTILKHLPAIENFGQMDVLCCDKTGTLTTGELEIRGTWDPVGQPSIHCAELAWINAAYQQTYANPLDAVLLKDLPATSASIEKRGEIPYDFVRKRLSVLIRESGEDRIITKGAVQTVLPLCTSLMLADNTQHPIEGFRAQIERLIATRSAEGIRLLALAQGSGSSEENLTLVGLIALQEPLKQDARQSLERLRQLGVRVKMITGDYHAVAQQVGQRLGLRTEHILTGAQLDALDDRALPAVASRTALFVEVDPNQKERIVRALRKSGHTVGYLGDGVNDVPVLRAADVGISVNTGSPASKEAADVVLLEKDLGALADGIQEGRRTFANTLKYVYMATSANFGNMLSLAIASLWLRFLPMLPKQVLLTNFLQDFPEMALSSDNVDAAATRRPLRWHQQTIQRFMLLFGVWSSVADLSTFALLYLTEAPIELFRSAWFVESVLSAVGVVLLIRTRGPAWRSRPSHLLLASTLVTMAIATWLPWSGLGPEIGLVPIPVDLLAAILVIVLFYWLGLEALKAWFFKTHSAARHGARPPSRLR